jgi:hypothetical protein
MKFTIVLFTVSLMVAPVFAQPAPTSVIVPMTLDHNRIIIDVRFPLPDGSTKRVRCWVDTGNPDMWMTERLATKLGMQLSGEPKDAYFAKQRMAQVPSVLLIGGMEVHATGIKEVHAMLDRESIGPGLSAEVNLPSLVLRNYDVIVDYPNREFTLAVPGSTHLAGTSAKVTINPENGLIQVPSTIEGQKYSLGLDVGAPFGFISSDLVTKWRRAHPQWPHLTGATGAANLWGIDDEPRWELLRIPNLQYGGVALSGVGVASFSKEYLDWFEKRAGVPTVGLMGANALLTYRVGIDYVHSTVYFQKTGKFTAPDMDVVGLILRPEPDERYTVIGVADYMGKPSVAEVKAGDVLVAIDKVPAKGGTMGQVWSLLSGRPGDVRTLTLQRASREFTVKATVHRFLAPAPQGKAVHK